MLKDGDARVRTEAANALLEFNLAQLKNTNNEINLIIEFTAEILSNEVPYALNHPFDVLHGFQNISNGHYQTKVKRVLGKHLFDLTNMLFELKSNEKLVN